MKKNVLSVCNEATKRSYGIHEQITLEEIFIVL